MVAVSMARNAPLLAALAAAITLAGCGGSSTSTSSSTPSAFLQFVARADAICRKANDRIIELHTPGRGPELASAARLLDEEVPIATGELDELRRLAVPRGAPARARAGFQEYLRVAAEQLTLATGAREVARAGDSERFHVVVVELAALSPTSEQAATHARLGECARTVEPHGR
jgi:hypothetical protein